MKLLKQSPVIIGVIAIASGLIANRWLLEYLLSTDGRIAPINVTIIWLFDVSLITIGLILLISRSFMTLFNVGVGLFFTGVLLYGLEWAFYYLNHRPAPAEATTATAPPPPPVEHHGEYVTNFFGDDALLGYKPHPNSQVDSLKQQGDEIIYDVIYTIDDHSRRITPTEGGSRSKMTLFFGDSFMFGEGVQDNETLPYHVARLAEDYQPYNYGFSGYGPQQMLAKLESEAFLDELNPQAVLSETIAIYIFIDAHVERAIGSMYVHNAWGATMPYYTVDWSGQLVRQGNFTTGRPVVATLYEWLPHSEIAQYFNVTLPPQLTAQHYIFTAQLIAAARDNFQTQFGSSQFYVVIYPDEGDYIEDLLPHLQSFDLMVLNYDEAMKLDVEAGLAIKGDGHPTGKAHARVAEWLVDDLFGENRP